MKKIFTLSFFYFTATFAFSQQVIPQFNYDVSDTWKSNPVLHKVHDMFDSSSAVGILQERKIECVFEGKEHIPFLYRTYHNIIKVKNDRGIEMFNKLYIPMYDNAVVSNIKARVILPNGQIINVDTTKIKQTEEDGDTYKIFAFEGVEKGAEVEYTFTIKRNFSAFGSEMFQSEAVPYQQENFMLIAPPTLRFSAKGYNGFHVSGDSVVNDKRIIVGYDTDVKQLEDEKYAYRDKYMERVDYKVSYNLDGSPDVRLYTWNEYAKKAYSYYTNYPSKEEKALNNFIQQINIPQGNNDAEKILAIEDYLKTNINIDKKLIAEGADDIEYAVKTKNANNDGAIRLFAAIFDKENINFQIVFPGDRSSLELDEDQENWNRLNDVLFYFPQTGKYISPVNVELRYPYFPFEFAGTKGLFLKGTTIGTFKTAIGTFADVNMEPFESNAMNMEADVKFNDTNDTLLISSKQILKGYGAAQYRPIYVFLPKDKQDDANKDIIKNVANSTDVSNIKVENTALTNFFENKPLIISGDIKSGELLENAGSKILLKIGEVIGQQEEMYQEKPRQLPVEMPFPHMEDRTITLHIPDGYTVKNPDDINSSIVFKSGDNMGASFTSSYTKSGNIITITIKEEYHGIYYPVTDFKDFQKVINASADFNKVVLVLEKK
jgi:hypothetical protein